MQKIVETLPFGLRQKWREKADSITEGEKRDVSIEDIADFLEAKARVANHPVFGSVTNISRNYVEKDDAKRRNRTARLRVFQGTNLATQGNLPDDVGGRVDRAENVVSVNPNLKCPLREANHWLTRCHLFTGKSYQERYKFVRERSLCDNCLQSGHVASSCPKQSFCQVSNCNLKHRKHSTFLHPQREQPEHLSTNLATPRAVQLLTSLMFGRRIALLVCQRDCVALMGPALQV